MTEPEVVERKNVEPGQFVMPFYVIVDVSVSMTPDIDELNQALEKFLVAVRNEPVVDDVAQVGVVSFSDDAKVVMPLAQPSEIVVRKLHIEGGTNYGAAFQKIAKVIDDDVAALKKQGYKVYRPCVFFMSDGEPQDRDWHQTFTSALTYDQASGTGMKTHPLFIPFGFRDASEDIMRQLAYPPDKAKWYFARTHSVDEALQGILHVIMQTVLTGGRTGALGIPPVPQPPAADSDIASGDSEYSPDWV